MNKPVAWVTKKALDDLRMPLISEITLRIAVKSKNTDPFNIPLYTHPVKELTDEEITELENALEVCDYKYFGHYEFSEKQWEAYLVLEKHARAILRKAQEK